MPQELWVVELPKDRPDVVSAAYHWKAGKKLRVSEVHANYLVAEFGAKVISKPKERAVKPPQAETAAPVRRVVLPTPPPPKPEKAASLFVDDAKEE